MQPSRSCWANPINRRLILHTVPHSALSVSVQAGTSCAWRNKLVQLTCVSNCSSAEGNARHSRSVRLDATEACWTLILTTTLPCARLWLLLCQVVDSCSAAITAPR